jgi:hypothetical protein
MEDKKEKEKEHKEAQGPSREAGRCHQKGKRGKTRIFAYLLYLFHSFKFLPNICFDSLPNIRLDSLPNICFDSLPNIRLELNK